VFPAHGCPGLAVARSPAFRKRHCLSVASLQLQSPLPLRRFGLHLLGFGERREQCLRFPNFGHFRCRREAFERRGEDGMGVDGAAGRLVELGE
jgi:hypothetical protein